MKMTLASLSYAAASTSSARFSIVDDACATSLAAAAIIAADEALVATAAVAVAVVSRLLYGEPCILRASRRSFFCCITKRSCSSFDFVLLFSIAMLVHLMQTGEGDTSAARSVTNSGPEHTHTLCILTADDDDVDDEIVLASPVALDVSSKFNFREQWQKFDGAREQFGACDTGDAGSGESTGLCLSQYELINSLLVGLHSPYEQLCCISVGELLHFEHTVAADAFVF